jgi:hypothetical protein
MLVMGVLASTQTRRAIADGGLFVHEATSGWVGPIFDLGKEGDQR